jgi:NAD(P)-dependent dehydrogenase (short-subunit alcohol dehydrogenase family)
VALARSAAIERAGVGVRVNAIAPGSIDTPMMAVIGHALGGDETVGRAMRFSTPLGRHRTMIVASAPCRSPPRTGRNRPAGSPQPERESERAATPDHRRSRRLLRVDLDE